MDDNAAAVVVAIIAAIGVVVAATITARTAIERWPAGLREAKRLTELIEKMDYNAQQRLARDFRDDLVASWVMRKVAPDAIGWFIALVLIRTLTVVLLLVCSTLVALFFAAAVQTGQSATVLQLYVPYVLGFGAAFVVAFAVQAFVDVKRDSRRSEARNAAWDARGLRDPVAFQMAHAEKERKSASRPPTHTAEHAETDTPKTSVTPRLPDSHAPQVVTPDPPQ
jgi:uncharacterized membrane protein YbhN (UPF0104 family)